MALSDLNVKARFTADGVVDTYAIPGATVVSGNISSETVVYLRDESVDPMTETLQTEGAGNDYTISGTNVVFNTAPTSGLKVVILSKQLPLTQTLDLTSSPTANPSGQESAYDRLVAMVQALDERVDRALKFQKTSGKANIDVPDPEASRLLAWDSTATKLENVTNEAVIDTPASVTDNTIPTFDGTDGLSLNATSVVIDDSDQMSGITRLDVDNVRINGNDISSINTNGDVTISPNGTGTVVINTDLDVDNININGNTISSTDTNGNISITPDGTGTVQLNGKVGGTAVLDEDDLSSDSDTVVPTQQSVKAYVDSGTVTMTNKTLTSAVLNTGVSGTAVLDEDNMASDSATQLATQQSIKAYVDSQFSQGLNLAQETFTGADTLDANNSFAIVDTSGGAFALTLPAASSNANKRYWIKKSTSDFDACTITPDGSDTIGGLSTTTLNTLGECIEIVSDGTSDWVILRRDIPSVWTSYTPTGSWTTNTTYTGMYKRNGDSLSVQIAIDVAGGAPGGTALLNGVTLPSGLSVDTAKLADSGTDNFVHGNTTIQDSSTTYYPIACVGISSDTLFPRRDNGAAQSLGVTNAAPFSFGDGDSVYMKAIDIPISGWNG